MDEGDFAMEVSAILENTEFVQLHGWQVVGLDIGEVEITTEDGERFRMSISRIADDKPSSTREGL